MTRRRDLTALATAVAACSAVLLAPAVTRSSVPPAAADPRTLAGAWPHARTFDIPGTIQSGDTYQPLVIVANGVSIGTTTSPDGSVINLIEVTSTRSPATVRVLQGRLDSSRVSFDAFTVTPTAVYMMRSTSDANGYGHESLWRIPQPAGTPQLMTSDAGGALFQGSVDDLQIAGGRVRWVASAPDGTTRTQLRSIPLAGGGTEVQVLHGQYILSTYPTLYSGDLIDPAVPQLLDPATGAVTAVYAPQNSGVSCDPQWCTVDATSPSGANSIEIFHPDGTGLRHLGDVNTSLVATDPTLLDRFVALTEQDPAMATNPDPTVQLILYDLRTGHTATVTGAASATVAVGRWLWWSTGDNETLTWHALDLSTLR
jgi:hypothetical protein